MNQRISNEKLATMIDDSLATLSRGWTRDLQLDLRDARAYARKLEDEVKGLRDAPTFSAHGCGRTQKAIEYNYALKIEHIAEDVANVFNRALAKERKPE